MARCSSPLILVVMREHVLILARALCLSLALAVCPGCFRPQAQVEADRLAAKVRDEPGCAQKLRQWFATIESASPSEKDLPVPDNLQSEWWHGARAHAEWSPGGELQKITVRRLDPWWGPVIVIGRPVDTAETLGLTRQGNKPPVFYAKITNGMYALWWYYK